MSILGNFEVTWTRAPQQGPPSCTPYNQNTSRVSPTSWLEPEPSASQPSTLQTEIPLFAISVFELQYCLVLAYFTPLNGIWTPNVISQNQCNFYSFSNTSHFATKQCPPSVLYCAAPKLFTKVPSIVAR